MARGKDPTKFGTGRKIIQWKTWVPKSIVPPTKGSKATIAIDSKGIPRKFTFNTSAFLDLLSAIDSPLSDRLSIEEYHSKKENPAGWLIDRIERELPVKEEFLQSIKEAMEQVKRGEVYTSEEVFRRLKKKSSLSYSSSR